MLNSCLNINRYVQSAFSLMEITLKTQKQCQFNQPEYFSIPIKFFKDVFRRNNNILQCKEANYS